MCCRKSIHDWAFICSKSSLYGSVCGSDRAGRMLADKGPWAQWESQRGEGKQQLEKVGDKRQGATRKSLTQGGFGFHKGHDNPRIFLLDHNHWHLHLLRAVPLLSSLNFFPWPSPSSQGIQPLPVSATSFTSTYNHAHILTTLKTSSHPSATSSLPSPHNLPPRGWSVDWHHQTALEHTWHSVLMPTQDLPNQNPCVCVVGVGREVEGSQDLCCNVCHGCFWSTFEKHCFPDGSAGKESACNAGDTGDTGLTPGLGRIAGGGNKNPLQYSCLGNPIDRGDWRATVHGVAESRAWLSTQAWHVACAPHLCFLTILDHLPLSLSCLTPQGSVLASFFLLSVILSLSDLSHSQADFVMYLFKHRCE